MERGCFVPEAVRLSVLSEDERKRRLSSHCSYYQLFDAEQNNGEWPLRTKERCRWCMHTFDSFPLGIPLPRCYDERLSKLVLSGYHCSFACR